MAVRIKIRSAYIGIVVLFFIGFLYFFNAVSYSKGVVSFNFNYSTYANFGLNPITFIIDFGIDVSIVVSMILIFYFAVQD